MFISSKLSIGEVAFILRVILQALLFGGVFLLSFLVLAHAPNIGTKETHDVLNRIIGHTSKTRSSATWLFHLIRAGKSDRSYPRRTSYALVGAITLFSSFAIFGSISDVGFIGVIPCDVPFPPFDDYPGSVRSDQDAFKAVQKSLTNPPDIHIMRSLRCESSIEIRGEDLPEGSVSNCVKWINTTFDTPSRFRDLNSTDTDSLIPNVMLPGKAANGDPNAYASFFKSGIQGPRITTSTIANGLLVHPHDTGVRAVLGVPNLSNNQSVTIPKTMVIEADVGCFWLGMSIGFDTLRTEQVNYFDTSQAWKESYIGPDYLYDPLAKNVERMRAVIQPFFNKSDIKQEGPGGPDTFWGVIIPDNKTLSDGNPYQSPDWTTYSIITQSRWPLDETSDKIQEIRRRNCTHDVHEGFGFPIEYMGWKRGIPMACGDLSIQGSYFEDRISLSSRRYLCTTSTNLSMATTTIQVDAKGGINLNLTKLPSDIHSTFAVDFVDPENQTNVLYEPWRPLLRFTLSDNPTGPLSHPIFQTDHGLPDSGFNEGLGSPGVTISELASRMLSLDLLSSYEGLLGIVNNQSYRNDLGAVNVTRWAGEMGASYLISSLAYNGWAARNSPPLRVTSTGGRLGTCYKLEYGIAFVPLFLAAVVILVWSAVVIFFSVSITLNNRIKDLYGGLAPYEGVVTSRPEGLPDDAILEWEDNDDGSEKLVVVVDDDEKLKATRDSERTTEAA